jgi:hypothetical protein
MKPWMKRVESNAMAAMRQLRCPSVMVSALGREVAPVRGEMVRHDDSEEHAPCEVTVAWVGSSSA